MVDSKQFNPLPLLSVKSGLDSSLAQISTELDSYFAEGWAGNEHLKLAHDELHRTVGVLQMLSLEGLAVFSREFETVLQEMLAQQQAPSALHRDTLRGAMLALTQYLDSLADGASNTALRLFYSYQELHQLRGLETAFEVDLFFPEFGVELPAEVLDVPLVASAAESVKKARAQYQRALLKWLRQENPAQSLRSMRAAVQTVMACAPQDQHRAFWWIATGLLDCLIHDGLPAELNANKLLARVDLQMKSMVEQKQRDTEYNTTCGMQYILARSHSVSDTVDKIKQTYVLESYLPEDQPLPYAEVVQVLQKMHDSLTVAQEILEQCEKGDSECGKRFVAQLDELQNLSEGLDHDTLQFLCKQMHGLVDDPDDADALHRAKMEMAIAMLLLGYGIDNYQHLGSQFHEQERMIVQCLKSESSIEPGENFIMPEITALHCQMAEQAIMLPLSTEIKGNLQQVELNLNVFFSDASKRSELLPLQRLLTQVYGALYLLSLDTAKQLIAPVHNAIERYVNGTTPSHAEMNAIASAVSTLENYVHGVSQGLKPDESSLKAVLGGLQTDSIKSEQKSAVQAAVIPTGVSVREGGEDAELLEVFLEEAQEVLETLHQHLGACQRNPHSREDLITIRRGFHTLKGSGRMVGLTNLGEVAWSVEKALNKWLQDEQPTSLSVLELIGDAEVLFQHWVEKLRSGDSALIDATALVAAAQRVESGAVEEKETEVKAQKETELPDIVIGGVSLSPVLFNIATDEAASIIETLQRLVFELRKGEMTVINNDFVRAAHTLAGVNRSTGFTDISDLAGALELWLQVCLDSMIAPDILQLNLLEQTINALAEMVNTLRRKQEPKPRPDLITRLQIKKKQLNESLEAANQQAETTSQPEPLPKIEEIPVEILTGIDTSHLDDEEDLVAYVQRVAQEQASEPLQWQSPEEKTTFPQQTDVQPAALAEVDSNLLSMDLSDLHLTIDKQPELDQIESISQKAEEFSINLDDMGFAPEALVEETPIVELESLEEYRSRTSAAENIQNSLQSEAQRDDDEDISAISDKSKTLLEEYRNIVPVTPAAIKDQDEETAEQSHDPKKRAIKDDLDEQLLPIFLEEADELYPQLNTELSAWRSNLSDVGEGQKIARKLQRSLHTLKGSARMAGAMRLGELTHRVEDCLDAAVAEGKHDAALMEELEGYFDRIGSALEKLRTGDTTEVAEQVAKVVAPKQNAMRIQTEQSVEVAEERKESAVLRVRSDVVDDLVNEAGEISVARSRMEVELSAFKGGLHDLTSSVHGLRKLVREIEMHAEGQMQARSAVAGDSAEKFDPLEFDRFTRFQELTRFMSESVHDVQTVQQALLKNLDETSAAMSAQAKLNSVLQQSLMSIRMLPFSNISQRLYRIVRQTGKELGKKANLELYGTEIELDRGVLEKMTAPFEHLLRNAIVHGLENPEQRELKGKPPIGNIALTLRQEGNEVVFEFKDDGAGLNTGRIRQKAIEQGLLKANEVISDEKAMLLIFETGLSTATELTEISGRGVGMDVVRSEIKALGGRVEVSSAPDQGACFTIYLPLTLAVMKSLMVRAGNDIYAIPSVMVEQVQQIKPDALVELYRKGKVEWQDKSYPLYYLPQLLGEKDRVPDSKLYNSILLLRSGDQRIAIHLDELLGNKEVVVKNVGAQLARLPGIAGATVQANGKVVLILNPVPLVQDTQEERKFETTIIQEAVRRIPVVMIVDDSLTVRKITTRLLTRAGYDVVTAKDGVDALEKLVDMTPDVMLLDVEMPRMDGFELTKQLRRDSKTNNLPIIMITSRTAEKHRNFAFELGVNEYMGKPYQDDELLESIGKFAPLKESATAI